MDLRALHVTVVGAPAGFGRTAGPDEDVTER
jgi:hypothetical protein